MNPEIDLSLRLIGPPCCGCPYSIFFENTIEKSYISILILSRVIKINSLYLGALVTNILQRYIVLAVLGTI